MKFLQTGLGVGLGLSMLMRVHAGLPGDLEPTFQRNPGIATASRVAAASALSEGRLLVVRVGENGPQLVRLNAQGEEDATFLTVPLPGFVPGVLATLSDGRILCGSFPDPARPTLAKIQRFQANGALDDSFAFEQTVLSLNVIAPLPTGDVMLAAKFEPATDLRPFLYLHRLTSTGVVDPGFELSGAFGLLGELCQVIPQGDGSLVMAGNSITRVGMNGIEDASFGGRVLRGRMEAATQLVDGRMIIAGRFVGTNGLLKAQIVRLQANGEMDPGFATTEYEGAVHRLAVGPDGHVLVGGAIARVGGLGRRGLGRLLPDGGVDPGFICHLAPNRPLSGGPEDIRVDGLGVRSDGRVFVAGQFQSVNGVPVSGPLLVLGLDSPVGGLPQLVEMPAKITVTEGDTLEVAARVISSSPVTSEWRSASGIIEGATLPEYRRRQVQRHESGTYELTVHNVAGSASKSVVVEVLRGAPAAGMIDMSFNAGLGTGPLTAPTGSPRPNLFVAAGVGGRIFLAGDFNQFGELARPTVVALSADGALDEGFAWPKDVTTFIVREVGAILPLPDGKLLVGMNMSRSTNGPLDRNSVGRFLPNGARDETFKNGDFQLTPARFTALGLDAKGRVLFGRRLTTTPLGRLELGSRIDPTFQPPEFLAPPGGALSVRVILPLPSGRILVGGTFDTVGGRPTGGLVRLEENGALDPSFQAALSSSLELVGAGLTPDGGILLGLSGAPGVVKLLPDGGLDPGFQAPSFLGAVRQLVVDGVGRVLVVPETPLENDGSQRALIRLLPSGRLDPEFEFRPVAKSLFSIALDPEGQVLAAGEFPERTAMGRSTVLRLHGAVDGELQAQRDATGSPVIRWASRLGHTYSMERAGTLPAGTWGPLLLEVQGTGKPLEFTDTVDGDRGFYRVRIE